MRLVKKPKQVIMAGSVTNNDSFNRRLKEGRDIGSLKTMGRLFHCLMTIKENEVGARDRDLGT